MANWNPISSYKEINNYGRLMMDVSLLGRFFKLSAFAEDDARIVEKYFPNVEGGNETITNETLAIVAKQIHPFLASIKAIFYNSCFFFSKFLPNYFIFLTLYQHKTIFY